MLVTVRRARRRIRSRPFRVAAPAAAGTAIMACVLAAGAPAAAGAATHAAAPAGVLTTGQWPVAGQNLGDTHFQAEEHKISPANVSGLAPKWTLTTNGNVSATPTVYAGAVYVSDQGGTLWAADARSGRVLWSHTIASYTGVAGDLSRTSPAVYGDELITGDGWAVGALTGGARVFAVNRLTGKLLWSARVDSFAGSIITSSPVVHGGVAYLGISSSEEALALQPGYQCCVFRGAVVALNARTDGRRIYVAEADAFHLAYKLGGSGPDAGRTVTGGSWAALDAATGKIIWQTPDPQTAVDLGFVSAANGVVYAGSNAGTGQNMYALDAATGKILWGFASGGAVVSGAAVVNGTIYWGSGYYISTCPAAAPCGGNDKLYAFTPH